LLPRRVGGGFAEPTKAAGHTSDVFPRLESSGVGTYLRPGGESSVDWFLTKPALHALLRDRGHRFWSEDPAEAPVDVWPSPETIVTVGLDAYATLKPAYRQRYYACVRNEEDEPLLVHDQAFALQGPFATAAEREPGNNYFEKGPLRWLLVRIRQLEQLLLWPRGGFRGADGLDFVLTTTDRKRINQTPRLACWFERHAPEPGQVAAAVLSLSDLDDCQALWEAAAHLVGVWGYDFFLSDVAARGLPPAPPRQTGHLYPECASAPGTAGRVGRVLLVVRGLFRL
jgi:hypothetical protein